MAALITVATAILAATAGYWFRRREHLRQRRIDAYRTLLAAFTEAARSAAVLQTVHLQVGWPEELSRGESNTPERIEQLASAHRDVFVDAATDRRAFDVASYGADLVAGSSMRIYIEHLRGFLIDVAYSGSPWERGESPARDVAPQVAVQPSEIEGRAGLLAEEFTDYAARELWGRGAPKRGWASVVREPEFKLPRAMRKDPYLGTTWWRYSLRRWLRPWRWFR